MCRKILLSALLCLTFQSVVFCQSYPYYFSTIAEAIGKRYNGRYYNSTSTGELMYIDIYCTVPSKTNDDPNRTVKYFICFYRYCSSYNIAGTYPNQTVSINSGSDLVGLYPGGYAVTIGGMFPCYSPVGVAPNQADGSYANGATVVDQAISIPFFSDVFAVSCNRLIWTPSLVSAFYSGINDSIDRIPSTVSLYSQSYSVTGASSLTKLDMNDLTRDYDGGGISDLDEIFRNPYPGSNYLSWEDDKDCECGSCCTALERKIAGRA